MSVDTAIENASASLTMEGFSIDQKAKELVRLVLENKMTTEEYIAIIKQKAGVSA